MDSNYNLNGSTNTVLHIEDELQKHKNSINKEKLKESLLTNSINYNKIIDIKRDAIDWDDFQVKYERIPQKEVSYNFQLRNQLNKSLKKFSIISWFISLFPIINWLPKYNIKTDLLPDFIVGITISVFHIPQGIAYSLLAGLDAVHGLYVSFFPVLIYTLMGTSRHISVGSFAVASLMLSNTASKLGSVSSHTIVTNITTNQTITNDWPPTTLEALTTVCIVTGFIQIAMGFLSLGSLSLILSDHLVSGFSTAVAFHVATSQLNNILGLSIPNQRSGPLKLIKTWIETWKQLHNINATTLMLSVILITILLIFKEFAEPRIKKRISFPIPIDLFIVIFSILISWIFQINQKYNVIVVGNVPTGLPKPTIPRMDFIPDIFIDCVITGIVTFAISLSLAKIFAKKHRYEVDANQELIALGTANIFSSFFMAYTASGSLSRSAIQERTGGKTQITGLVSCGVILIILLFWAPFLYHLPKSTLSCIIIIALKTMFSQIADFKKFWFLSKLDAITWMVTFLSVILLDVDLGLIVGIFISILVILIRLVLPMSSLLGSLPSTEIYVDLKKYRKAKELNGVKIFRFSSPVFYLSIDKFKSKVLEITHINEKINDENKSKLKPEALIIDLSCVPFMDKSGVETIIDIIKILKEQNISVCLASSPIHVIEMFERTEFFNILNNKYIYPTIHDAVISLKIWQ